MRPICSFVMTCFLSIACAPVAESDPIATGDGEAGEQEVVDNGLSDPSDQTDPSDASDHLLCHLQTQRAQAVAQALDVDLGKRARRCQPEGPLRTGTGLAAARARSHHHRSSTMGMVPS